MKKLMLSLFLGLFFGSITSISASKEKIIVIPQGSHTKKIVTILHKESIIQHPKLFLIYLKTSQLDAKLHAGEFRLSLDYSYAKIAAILQGKEGPTALVSVTIPEGYSLKEISKELKRNQIIKDSVAFENYIKRRGKATLSSTFAFLQEIPTSNLEGYLFPETYYFSRGSSFKTITKTFLTQFQKELLPLWADTDAPKMSLHASVTLASIVERESQRHQETPIIAGVFHNRLKRNMFLASCPTIGYAIGVPRKKIITFTDLKVNSPYNTYKNKGLPPTPIASPGKQAFKATLNPKKTNYLYFVATGDGSHIFNETYAAHLESQRKIIQKAL